MLRWMGIEMVNLHSLRHLRYILIIGISFIFAATSSSAGVFNPETFMLKNGMQVVVIPNHRVPVVTHMVWYKVGSADEQEGESGIAHFLEHLMFKGTKTLANGEFSRILAKNGGQQNAFTSTDYTAYFQNVAIDRLEMVMRMEADRMTNLVLSRNDILTERDVVLEERRSRTGNNPAALLREQANASLFLNYPYRRPIIGWAHEISNLDYTRVINFYKRWYAPNNAILVVSGDITAENLKPLAEKYYGIIPSAKPISRNRAEEPPHNAARQVVLKDPRVRQPAWSKSYLAPSYKTGNRDHAYALEVLVEFLGAGATSPLFRSLVMEQRIAVGAGAFYNPNELGPSQFGFHASPARGIPIEKVKTALMNEVAKLIKDGVSEGEISRAKQRLQDEAIYARDSSRAGAQVLGAALAIGLTVDDVESWPERISAVTVEQVNAALAAVVNDKRSVTAILLPEKLRNKGAQ
jgi:zinc protease